MTDNGSDFDRWSRVKEIFEQAVSLDPDEQAAFLHKVCGGDELLRADVDELIRSDQETDDFLESAAIPSTGWEASGQKLVGTRIGKYRIVRIISSGGMGIVYEAIQEQPRRTVAIKVMKEGIANQSSLRRFEYEAQILARLRHPGIAHVIEAGTHQAEGLFEVPYFVMEYIPDAMPLTDYALSREMTTRQRIDLFMQACEAVYHGHQKGVIHRDLKPGNILVDGQGQVKIIDFGVARATDSDVTITRAQTDVSLLMGTVQYMSPEQCAADPHDLDTRSDVYALGVVLYELLCEQLPYDVRQAAIFEATRLIREEPPKRPSTVNRALRGDIETIVLKALEKEREHRYQTVNTFSSDLRRFLNNEVILARPAGPAMRLWKTVKRNPVLSAALSAAFLFLLAFLLYETLWSIPRLREERDRVVKAGRDAREQRQAALDALEELETEAGTTGDLNDFLLEMLSSADPYCSGQEVDLRQILDNASERIEGRFRDRPVVEASLRFSMGSIYTNCGCYEAAEKQLRRALELGRQHFDPEDKRLYDIIHALSVALIERGRLEEADPYCREALDGCRHLLGDDDLLTISCKNSLASRYRDAGLFQKAEILFLECMESLEQACEETKSDYNFLPLKIGVLTNIAHNYHEQARMDEAERLYIEVLDLCRSSMQRDNPAFLRSLNNLAVLYEHQGRYDKSEPLLMEALDRRRRVQGDDHPDTLTTMGNLGCRYRGMKRLDEAEATFREALDIRRKTGMGGQLGTLICMVNLAGVYTDLGRFEEASELHRSAIEQGRLILNDNHPKLLSFMNNHACLLYEQKKFDEAESLFVEILEKRRTILPEDHPAILSNLQDLANAYLWQKRPEKALPLVLESLEKKRRILGDDHSEIVSALHYLASTYERMGRLEEAEPVARELVERTPTEHQSYERRKKLLDRIRRKLETREKNK